MKVEREEREKIKSHAVYPEEIFYQCWRRLYRVETEVVPKINISKNSGHSQELSW